MHGNFARLCFHQSQKKVQSFYCLIYPQCTRIRRCYRSQIISIALLGKTKKDLSPFLLPFHRSSRKKMGRSIAFLPSPPASERPWLQKVSPPFFEEDEAVKKKKEEPFSHSRSEVQNSQRGREKKNPIYRPLPRNRSQQKQSKEIT